MVQFAENLKQKIIQVISHDLDMTFGDADSVINHIQQLYENNKQKRYLWGLSFKVNKIIRNELEVINFTTDTDWESFFGELKKVCDFVKPIQEISYSINIIHAWLHDVILYSNTALSSRSRENLEKYIQQKMYQQKEQ
ncbi:MAG: hypothetical protein LBL75_03925 [Rickettsiales bacterium]|jgi:hypothetical protein|nr:hypothetical protein [Rickettsiales bacterium]